MGDVEDDKPERVAVMAVVADCDGNEVEEDLNDLYDSMKDWIRSGGFRGELRAVERTGGVTRLEVAAFENEHPLVEGERGVPLMNEEPPAVALLTPGPIWCDERFNLLVDDPDRLRPIGGTAVPFSLAEFSAGGEPDGRLFEVLLDGRAVSVAALIIGLAYWRGALAAYESAYGEAEESAPVFISQDVIRPRSHVQGISKVSDKITEVANGEEVLLDMGGPNEPKGTVLTPLSLAYEGDGIEISRPITPFDREVHNAVATLWAAGNRAVTPRQVYQTMTGSRNKPSAKAVEAVEASLDKQRRTFVTIDFSKEMRGKTAEFEGEEVPPEQGYETYMLEADKAWIQAANGVKVIGYSIEKAPILYRHDHITGQLISYPQRLLEATSEATPNTETALLMRSYLIKRIKTMSRKGSKMSRQIRYDSIYEAIGRQGASRTQRSRMSKTVKAILDVFESAGFIAGWSEYADKGRSHRLLGVTIIPKQSG